MARVKLMFSGNSNVMLISGNSLEETVGEEPW